jgi:hypothetical protein
MTAAEPASEACRLCGGVVSARFSLRILQRREVLFLQCSACGSLQTERPDWLADAYTRNLAALDTGAAQRNINSLAASWAVARLCGFRDIVDFGGGDGLLCRLLRDYGLNCYVADMHASATYALAFTQPDFERPELLLLFEVAEHFAKPRAEFDALFERRPAALLMSTDLYTGQGPDWPYLTAQSGQHVFFYSERALEKLAQVHGYRAFFSAPFVLMVDPRRVPAMKARILSVLLRRPLVRMSRVLMAFLPARGVAADFDRLRRPFGTP